MMKDQDTARKERVVRALMQMKKLDIVGLEAGWRG
jgi:hypothetical protein